MEEVVYEDRIDSFVIFINGLARLAIELKLNLSTSVQDAIKCAQGRNLRIVCFEQGVHSFAVDNL